MKLSFLRLGWRTLLRDLRAGELRLLMVAVTLAVAALTSVGFFADRLQGGLQRDALQLLGGDVEPLGDTGQSGRIGREIAVVGIIVGSPGVHKMVLIGHGGQSPKKTGIHHAHGDGISP